MTTGDAVLIYSTCPDRACAERIGRALVDERLCACANIVPGMHAIYRWRGAVETADEVVLLLKTLRRLEPAVTARLRGLHPYQEPCAVALPITGGSAGYLAWLAESVDG